MDIERAIEQLEQQASRRHEEVIQRLTVLETTVGGHGDSCPYRVEIARAANNIMRLREAERSIKQLDDAVVDLRIRAAVIAVAVSTATSVFGAWVLKALGL